MANKSKIAWTDATWPIVGGCTKVSEACQHCYAIRECWRMAHNPNPKISSRYSGLVSKREIGLAEALNWTGSVRCPAERIDWPLKWREPRRIFVTSMGDLFHDEVPDDFIDRVFAVVALTPRHTYQVLTKRAARMVAYMTDPATPRRIADYMSLGTIITTPGAIDVDGATMARWFENGVPWPLPNTWLGVTAENQRRADERIPLLLQAPAVVRFVSIEPLLGPVDLRRWLEPCGCGGLCDSSGPCPMAYNARRLSWVIVGCESGPRRRSTDLAWARSIKEQCQAAYVPLFIKQLEVDGKIVHMPPLDGRVWAQFPVETRRQYRDGAG